MNIPPYDYLEFYQRYNVDFWPTKIGLLQSALEEFGEMKKFIYKEINDPNDENTIIAIKTDIHFLYFQMVEALFELIFALQKMDEKNIWYNLSVANKKNYDQIREIAKGTNNILPEEIYLTNPKDNSKVKTPFLQYVFYRFCSLETNNIVWTENLNNIQKLIRRFAIDFSDRNEYNAFKHSLRLLYGKECPKFETVDKKHSMEFKSENNFTYLEKYSTDKHEGISLVTKSFDPKLDLKLCTYCSWLITNIIITRRNFYFKCNDPILLFDSIDLEELKHISKNEFGKFALNIFQEK